MKKTTKPVKRVSRAEKARFRMKMRNLRYMQLNPDRRMVKVTWEAGDFFPQNILDLPEKTLLEQEFKAAMKRQYMELQHSIRMQKKYKHSCQSESAIGKLKAELDKWVEPDRVKLEKQIESEWNAMLAAEVQKKIEAAEKRSKWNLAHRRGRKHGAYKLPGWTAKRVNRAPGWREVFARAARLKAKKLAEDKRLGRGSVGYMWRTGTGVAVEATE